MSKSRFHFSQLHDSAEVRPVRDPRTGDGRRLTVAEIAKTFAGVGISVPSHPVPLKTKTPRHAQARGTARVPGTAYRNGHWVK